MATQTETKRLYQVLKERLAKQQAKDLGLWIVGGEYTCFSWVNWAEWAGVPTKPFPKVEDWMNAVAARPATERIVNLPDRCEMKEPMKANEGQSIPSTIVNGS
ncbi:hypothetical protein NA57DRAFT_73050 [Rhizodiscina lignyota]|uniref:Glutathione S-transferase n=1 Tax=Rhizodiscina lignyota TaxID=1504668 RepID=A0A9P4ILU7_9PEZI|nr:hypothetical protein NA57DRAFT_73050 [Rhizodiscina lignyota]